MTTKSNQPLRPPRRSAMLKEVRALKDITAMAVHQLRQQVKSSPRIGNSFAQLQQPSEPLDQAQPMIVLPGFGATDRSTYFLRRMLNQQGYLAEGWGLGRNLAGAGLVTSAAELSERWNVDRVREHRGEASVPALCDQMADRVEQRANTLGRPITLIGWSLGGYVAREVARDLPDAVNRVITMGSPVIGGPKYTAAADYFAKQGQDLDWIEAEVAKRYEKPITQPVTAIISPSDAVIAYHAAYDHQSPHVTNITVEAAHLGMGFNIHIWQHILAALAGHHDQSMVK